MRSRGNASELLEMVGSFEFEEAGGWLRVCAIAFTEHGLSLELELHGVARRPSKWRVSCDEFLDHRLCCGSITSVAIESEHPVLWRYDKPQRQIYFRGPADSPHTVIGAIAETHWRLAGNWLPLRTFLNQSVGLSKLLEGGHGLFADAPQPLVDAYEGVLSDRGLSVSGPPSRPPQHWDGNQWVVAPDDLRALILGESYIVARRIEAHRIT